MKWYLAGPTCHVTDGSDAAWRERAKKELDYIDPFEEEADLWPEERLPGEQPKDTMNRLRRAGNIHKVRELMQEVLRLDEESVTQADGVLAYSPSPSWGTIREVALAYQQGKPVVLWTEATGWDLSNTQIALSTSLVSTLDDAIQRCKELEGIWEYPKAKKID